MARQGWGRHSTVATGSDSGDQVSVNAWNADTNKAGMLGFTAQTLASATSVTPTGSTLILSGSTNVSTITITETAEYDLLYVFTSGTVTLVNTSSPSSAGDIKLLANVDKDLSATVPTILIRKGDFWIEYGGGITNSLNDIGDVVITSVDNEDVLAYDSTTSKWINQSADETGRVTADSTTTFTNKTIDQDGTGNSITNIANASIKASAAIDATKIADGSVTSTEFQYINTLSSNAQTQLNAKSPSAGSSSIVTTGALDSGSITSGFGNINIGSSTFTTSGAVTTGAITAPSISGSSGSTTGNAATATTATTVSDNAITLAKMAAGTDGNLITYDANGDPAYVTTGTSTQVLTSNGLGAAPTFQDAAGGGAVDYTELNTNSSTTYEGSAQGTRFATLGQGVREIYIKKIDANNEGVFTLVYKNGTVVEVQIA